MKKLSPRSREWRSVVEDRHWGAQEGGQILAVWERSGEPVTVFARKHGLSPGRLLRWRRRLLGKRKATRPVFHPVRVVPTVGPAPLHGFPGADVGPELELRVGRSLRVLIRRGFDAEALKELVQAAESWEC